MSEFAIQPNVGDHDPLHWADYARDLWTELGWSTAESLADPAGFFEEVGRDIVRRAFEVALASAMQGDRDPFRAAYVQATDEHLVARRFESVEAMIRAAKVYENPPEELVRDWIAHQGVPDDYYDEYERNDRPLGEFAADNFPWYVEPGWREPAWSIKAGEPAVLE